MTPKIWRAAVFMGLFLITLAVQLPGSDVERAGAEVRQISVRLAVAVISYAILLVWIFFLRGSRYASPNRKRTWRSIGLRGCLKNA
jgi:hypothetical protein